LRVWTQFGEPKTFLERGDLMLDADRRRASDV